MGKVFCICLEKLAQHFQKPVAVRKISGQSLFQNAVGNKGCKAGFRLKEVACRFI